MAFGLVQKASNSAAAAASVAVTLTATGAGNLLVAVFIDPGVNTDTPPANWLDANCGNGFCKIYYRPNCPAGITSVTFNSTNILQDLAASIGEFSGGEYGGILDKVGTASPVSGTTGSVSTTLATSGAGNLIVAGALINHVETSVTVAGGFSDMGSIPTGSMVAHAEGAEYKIGGAGGTESASFTWSALAATSQMAIATFHVALPNVSFAYKGN